MTTEHELQLEEAARDAERERLRDIEYMREDAIADSERGLRALLFNIADSIATGAVYGIGAVINAAMFGLAYAGTQASVAWALLITGVPFFALTVVLGIIAGPLHNSDSDRHRHYANVAIIVWLVAMLTFLVGVLSAVT